MLKPNSAPLAAQPEQQHNLAGRSKLLVLVVVVVMCGCTNWRMRQGGCQHIGCPAAEAGIAGVVCACGESAGVPG